VAIVGAHLDDDNGKDAGAAYIYRLVGSTWVQEAKLTASDGQAGDRFGKAVAVSGNVAVVGAFLGDLSFEDCGAAYVFTYNGSSWTQEAKLTASDASTSDFFGWSVATTGSTVVVGAYGEDDGGTSAGAAYVFVDTGSAWIQEARLKANDADASDFFGIAVAASGVRVLVGAYLDEQSGVSAGSAYVFRDNGASWVQETKLAPAILNDDDRFGGSVAMSGDVAVIGAFHDDDLGTNSGAAYVFERSGTTWPLTAKLKASDGEAYDKFGSSVGVSGGLIVIGAYWDDEPPLTDSGSAYAFRDQGLWVQEAKLVAEDPYFWEFFGNAVAVSQGMAIVGAYNDNTNGMDAGAAYVFDGGDPPVGCSTPSQCNDGNPCTADTCQAGNCVNTPLNCNDGNGCTVDSCSNGACLHTPLNCGDGNACTTDTCVSGNCVHTPLNCTDNNSCTIDGCLSGSCTHTPLNCSDSDPCTTDSCFAGVCSHTPITGCGPGSCQDTADCADLNGDGVRDDGCTWWTCLKGECLGLDTVFADLGGAFGDCRADGTVDSHDRFHALNCFANEDTAGGPGYPCEEAPPAAFNVDAGGPFGSCAPDGFCDGHDAYHAVAAFDGSSDCTCGGAQPGPAELPPADAAATLALKADSGSARAGDLIEVDVLLDGHLADLRGYQLHLHSAGGERGRLDLVDVYVAPRPDHVFAGAEDWSAFNVETGQMVLGLSSPGVETPPTSYLVTFVYQATRDARGEFTVDVVLGASPEVRPSYLFPTPAGTSIKIDATEPAVISVGKQRE
jgi:hypothetical protein